MARFQPNSKHIGPVNHQRIGPGVLHRFRLSERWDILLILFPIVLIYYPMLNYGFVDFDTPAYVFENDRVLGGFSAANIRWAFDSFHLSNYHPLTWISHMLDVTMYGEFVTGHRLTNLILHMLNGYLCYAIMMAAVGSRWPALVVTLLFVAHPAHVESVAWIAERKGLLSTFFGFGSIWFYIRYAQQGRTGGLILSIAAFAMSLLAKPMLVTLPILLLAVDYWPLGRWTSQGPLSGHIKRRLPWHLAVEKLPYLALSLVISWLTIIAQHQSGAMASRAAHGLAERTANALYAYTEYLIHAVWPAGLCVFYPLPTHALWETVLYAGALAMISVFVWNRRASAPWLAVGWFWFVVSLIPVIGLIQVGQQAMADRYTYVPYLGLFVMVACALDPTARKTALFSVARAIVVLAIVSFTAAALRQVGFWQNSETLYRRALAVTEHSALVHYNLGVHLSDTGRVEEAEMHYREALKITPGDPEILNNLGTALERQGRTVAAQKAYVDAVGLRPGFYDALYNLANLYRRKGRDDDAAVMYRRALSEKPDSAPARNNLANTLVRLGMPGAAMAHYRKVLDAEPSFTEAAGNLSAVERLIDDLCRMPAGNPVDEPSVRIREIYSTYGLRIEDAAVSRIADALDPESNRSMCTAR